MFSAAVVFLMALVAQATCQEYDPHYSPVQQIPQTETSTSTTTVTQTIRVPTTSDVWVSSVTQHPVWVTHLVTEYSYVPNEVTTVTGIITVTSTSVSLVVQTSYIQPVRTAVSAFTSFVTETVTEDFHHSITHVRVHHQFQTVPEHSVQTLVQRVTTTDFRLTTVTVTYTKTY